MVLKHHNIVIPINIQKSNLPIIYNSYVTLAKNKYHGPPLISGMAFIGLDYLGFFGYLRKDTGISGTEEEVIIIDEFDKKFQLCGPCVEYSENKNVIDTQT